MTKYLRVDHIFHAIKYDDIKDTLAVFSYLKNFSLNAIGAKNFLIQKSED